ncbi:13102_t:CDS:2 [Funneliformis geosporum]|nr:13102_t:CDS:2 [Funneliformis geosporum]
MLSVDIIEKTYYFIQPPSNITRKKLDLNGQRKTSDINLLLLFLKAHKKELKQLVEKRGGSGNIKKELWKCASIIVSDNENIFLPEQCEFKKKNIKQACK